MWSAICEPSKLIDIVTNFPYSNLLNVLSSFFSSYPACIF